MLELLFDANVYSLFFYQYCMLWHQILKFLLKIGNLNVLLKLYSLMFFEAGKNNKLSLHPKQRAVASTSFVLSE
jgi:hypothetical protein